LDMNFCNCTTQEFAIRYGGGTTNGGTMYFKAMGNITIRSTPEINDVNKTGSFVLLGDVVEVDVSKETNGFARLINRYRDNIKLSLPAEAWCGTFYLQATVFTPPPEAALPDLPVTITLGDDVKYIKQTINVILKPK